LNKNLKTFLIAFCLSLHPVSLFAAAANPGPQTPVQLESLQTRAASGDEKAQMRLARIYLGGQGVPANFDKAIYYYGLVAERDIAFAQHRLARIYLDGTHVDPDPVIALGWLQRAASLGYVPAQLDLSLLYETGAGVPPDLTESYKWFVIATSLTDSELDSRRVHLEAKMTSIELAHGEILARMCMLGGYRDC
jgi:TPR repeat protein